MLDHDVHPNNMRVVVQEEVKHTASSVAKLTCKSSGSKVLDAHLS